MALACDGQGQIPVMDIINAVNENETGITDNENAITILDGRVTVNETNIFNNTTRITNLEAGSISIGDLNDLDARVSVNEVNIAANAADISTNTGDISTNQADIATNTANVTTLMTEMDNAEIRLDSLDASVADFGPRISQNELDIAQLQFDIGVGFQGALLQHNVPSAGSVGGGSSSTAWTARVLNEVKYNSIVDSTTGPTSITLPIGKYKIEALAMGEGSIHQSKIVTGGGIEMLGTLMSGAGMSHVCGDLDLAAPDSISVATIVQTPVIDTGFGVPSPFTENAVYVMLKIEKVG